ncbi:MAG: hypothetical protein OEX07_13735 [Gammaproteobacteria bacterium]|nr:hypothetical protein [Gammaproteobacteria bacterium]
MASRDDFQLVKDTRGVYWDLALYVPTVIALASVAFQLWYSGNQNFTYLLLFLTTFIALIGFNRIAKTRLMLLASSPVALSVSRKGVSVSLRSGDAVELVNEVRFFSDFAGKSIGLTGLDMSSKRCQFVFHKGQFSDDSTFDAAKAALRIFK